MTIQFFCPSCNEIIGFPDKHAGRRARCTNCGQLFIIPSENYAKPKKVKLPEEKGDPLPGFYRAVFVDSWKLFFDSENVTSLAFVIAMVCFKFFKQRMCFCDYITSFAAWGWLFGFYLNIIYETTFEIDKLPEIYLGTSITFLWYIVKPLFIFSITLAVVQLPSIIRFFMLKEQQGLSFNDIPQLEFGLLHVLFIFGLFLFPMAILTASVGQTFTMFRPDYLLGPIFKTFFPYCVTVLLLVAAAFFQMWTPQFTRAGFLITAGHLVMNFAVQVIAIFAMRSIGLFMRHYNCYFAW